MPAAKRNGQPGTVWTEKQITTLRALYGQIPIRTLSVKLKRRPNAIHQMAWRLGMQRTRYTTGKISQERYERHMAIVAIFNGVNPKYMFRDLHNGMVELSTVKFAAWASIRAEGYSYSSMAKAAGMNHTSIMHGVRRHAEIMAQRNAGAAE